MFTTAPPEVLTPEADLADLPIVVLDDNETSRHILTEIVEGWGMCVVTAATAEQALDALENCLTRFKSQPLLLSDVNMPKMDGFMLAEEIRSRPHFKNLAIILLTSGGQPGDVKRCQQLDVSAHLMKPVKRSELHEALTRAAEKHAQVAPIESLEKVPTLRPLMILLAEDSKANQVLAMGLLKKWGHHVVVAEDGAQALVVCQDRSFDLVLMDVQMPVMDGLEATRQIRERGLQTGNQVPIVAMTARAMKGDRECCLQAGMDDYVAKPIRKDELYAILSRLFSPDESDESRPSTSSLIDWQQALESVSGDTRMLHELAQAALEELRELIQPLDEALAGQDLATVQRVAHTIKSSSRILAAAEVDDAAAATEEAARAEDVASVETVVGRLRELIPLLSIEIETFLDQ
jgi:CheY-like chemotaxis protein